MIASEVELVVRAIPGHPVIHLRGETLSFWKNNNEFALVKLFRLKAAVVDCLFWDSDRMPQITKERVVYCELEMQSGHVCSNV